jgi:nucleoside-diphosphate-sugar epimerase
LGRPRLLIVGCGDIGGRIVARLAARFRIVALTSSPERIPLLRAAGTVPIAGNLDRRPSLARLRGLAARVLHLAPPPEAGGRSEPRTRALLAALRSHPDRLVYVSTTGVYGNRGGARVEETSTVAPKNERAYRRLDAERRVRAAGGCVLRVPGIYARDRLPLARLRAGTPALAPEDDVYTNARATARGGQSDDVLLHERVAPRRRPPHGAGTAPAPALADGCRRAGGVVASSAQKPPWPTTTPQRAGPPAAA